MTIYPDTSFVIALRWNRSDHHEKALRVFSRFFEETHEWLWSPWLELEVFHAVRQFRHSPEIRFSAADSETLVKQFKADLAAQYFRRVGCKWHKALACAETLSRQHSPAHHFKTADLLHVAFALELAAEAFATFDLEQESLAKTAGLKVICA